MTLGVKCIGDVRRAVREARGKGLRIGLVPTMGALHEGHASLIRAARAECGYVVVSLFVNPTQFGPGEDLARYPRPLENDLAVCRREGADLAFAPAAAEMYPEGFATAVCVAGLPEKMCGAVRPGHFDGVCTVVAKLLAIVQPDAAYFGEKDAQQLAIVRRMAADLNLPLEIRGCPLVREPDGLAMSSRNAYLSPEERQRALAISAALADARKAIESGERDAAAVADRLCRRLQAARGVELQYVAVVDPDTLADLERIGDKVVVAVAAKVGTTRLIDNVLLRGL
ncbi:MAG: pantoate--beta-alanine ligase [Planctomycetota bacterium]|nr:pantoate--beta-alanine ligase [Planctomycetota bacterium]